MRGWVLRGTLGQMCGIVGLYNMPHALPLLPGMLERIAHRGPDAGSTWQGEGAGWQAALGHRRLSIIDLSDAANQPFVKDGLALVFNGEIYNYRQLRSELEQRGARFRTQSDTEVLLEAWRHWGAAALPRLRGMFAFGLLEQASGRLVLARDHYGIKPLHYAERGGGLVFGSELKAILPALGRAELDPQGLVAMLAFGWASDSFCVWQGVRKLPAGHYATIGPGGHLKVERFHDLRAEAVAARQRTVTTDELAGVLADSVSAHMIADVPVSTFLSGGLDSSLITVLARQQAGSLDSYTIAFRPEDMKLEAMPDDLKYARMLAKQFGIRLHEIEIAPDITAMLPRLVDVLDEPIGDAAAINTVLICEAARKAGVKVLLSGMGADEIFAGYRKHQAALLAARYRQIPAMLRKGLIEPVANALPVAVGGRGLRSVRFAKRFLSFANLPDAAAFRRSYTYMDEAEAGAILRPDLAALAGNVFADHDAIYDEAPDGDAVNRMCYTDIRLFMQTLNLTYTDRASMAASTEVRVPFIDKEVIAAALAIPGSRKIVGQERKACLKEAALRWLPREIVYRPKALFSAPLRAWIKRDLQQPVEDLVANGRLVDAGWLDRAWVRRLIDDDRAGAADRSRELWQLLTIETWLRHHDLKPT
jgi:asparagine synthase (glutamine-hydrolysing)